MKTVRHTPNLVRLTRLRAVNAFFVVEDDGLTLVDTMIPRSQDAILAAARELDAPIVRIALTHAHGDHVGSLDALAAALPQAEVSISARDARFLAGDMSLDPDEPQSKLRGGYPRSRRVRADCWRRATGSARSRSSPPPATRPGRSRSSTPATGR